MSQPEAVKDNPRHARSAQRRIRFSLKGREVGVAPEMLVPSAEQVSEEAEGVAGSRPEAGTSVSRLDSVMMRALMPRPRRRHSGVPRTAHAVADTVKAPGGNCAKHRARKSACALGGSRAMNAPTEPTPSRNGSHHSSNPPNRTSTATVPTSVVRMPACANNSARWPFVVPARDDSPSMAGSISRAASQNAASGPRPF